MYAASTGVGRPAGLAAGTGAALPSCTLHGQRGSSDGRDMIRSYISQGRHGSSRSSSRFSGAQLGGRWRRGTSSTTTRTASQQAPSGAPLRNASRDRMLGLLTERAAKTLLFYFSELNPTLMQWLEAFMVATPIPAEGSWEDVSGDTFLRKLLSMPIQETRWNFYGREQMYAKSSPLGVDPRSIAQRIMEIRAQIAREWVEELREVSEENALLMRETVLTSFGMADMQVVLPTQATDSTHPELLHPDFAGWKAEGPGNGSSPPAGGSS